MEIKIKVRGRTVFLHRDMTVEERDRYSKQGFRTTDIEYKIADFYGRGDEEASAYARDFAALIKDRIK